MALQGRNEMCGCGREKKYKKCCGRFTLEELLAKLSAYAAANKQKDKLIERSLRFLRSCEINRGGAFLILVKPVIAEREFIDWTAVGSSNVETDVREAVVTRRILAGYLPICCLVEDKSVESGWRAVIVTTLVEEECRDEFVAFAQIEATVVAKTFNGEMPKEDSWMTGVPWEDMSYPGMPMKPRPAGTIRIEVNIAKRTITTVWPTLGAMEFPLPEEHVTGNDLEDIIYEARHLIEALKRVDPPKQLVDSDRVEVWQMVTDGENKLLATTEVHTTPPLTRSEFDVKGDKNVN